MKKLILFISLLSCCNTLLAQQDSLSKPQIYDTTLISFTYDSTFLSSLQFVCSAWDCYPTEINHYPDAADSSFVKEHASLIGQEPTEANLVPYFDLACSLWDMSRNEEAKAMFLKIIKSDYKLYNATTKYSSDIPGDTSGNIYGYGSFSYNYKHQASVYLAKIYIEEREYKKALTHLDHSQHKYKTEHNCGTGYNYYISEIYGLYIMTYSGLGQDKKIIQLLLPECFDKDIIPLREAIKREYTPEQISKELNKAEQRAVFHSTYKYDHYTLNTCTTRLFGQQVNLPYPTDHFLIDDEAVTKEAFIEEFRKSDFYTSLTE